MRCFIVPASILLLTAAVVVALAIVLIGSSGVTSDPVEVVEFGVPPVPESLDIPEGVPVRVNCVSQTGIPVMDATVAIEREGASRVAGKTDANGRWSGTLGEDWLGEAIVVTVRRSGYKPYRLESALKPPINAAALDVMLLSDSEFLYGSVRDGNALPVAHASIEAICDGGRRIRTSTSSNGNFELTGPAPIHELWIDAGDGGEPKRLIAPPAPSRAGTRLDVVLRHRSEERSPR